MQKFSNPNAISLTNWLRMSSDPLNAVAFTFISRRNSTSARYFPLLSNTKKTRIVVIYGLKLAKTDRISLLIFRLLKSIFKRRCKRYAWYHETFPQTRLFSTNEILHLDDPTYSDRELSRLRMWESGLRDRNLKARIICTNNYTKDWLKRELRYAQVSIIEQGFSPSELELIKFKDFTCVYSSPYIHYTGDAHGEHTTWGCATLFDEIIGPLNTKAPNIKFRLIGELGNEAKRKLSSFSNSYSHGLVSQSTNQEIIERCHVGLYPRTYDHKRSMKKIFDYIGAGIPIVTFDLIDSEIVKKRDLGLVVNSSTEFVEAIIALYKDKSLYNQFTNNALKERGDFLWSSLAEKLEALY
jgi:glycosyltransferase involved in cell wall biosynthesis